MVLLIFCNTGSVPLDCCACCGNIISPNLERLTVLRDVLNPCLHYKERDHGIHHKQRNISSIHNVPHNLVMFLLLLLCNIHRLVICFFCNTLFLLQMFMLLIIMLQILVYLH